MKNQTHDIIPDSDVERVHGNANFGGMAKRLVVDEGVLKTAFGYSCGHTQICILTEHGLFRRNHQMTERGRLTAKGKRYLQGLWPIVRSALDEMP